MAAARDNYFVYLLRCADGTFYTGMTNNLERRLAQHQAGKAARYTSGRRPVALVYAEACGSRSQALQREAGLRKLKPRAKAVLAGRQKAQRGTRPQRVGKQIKKSKEGREKNENTFQE
ncbi:GIY-YIG nuclease family protein [candidate division KSB1 bacterium]|nr:GIY-YIG nuclease family protein [bacterium]NUM64201.1 GIY-YIG nuclease family protein [candidate division KSB1 bacterium]